MNLNEAIWQIIESRPKITTDDQKRSLHIDIMRVIEQSKSMVGKKLGVTIMTQEASQAGDKVNQSPGHRGNHGEAKPKSV
jgi:2-keto-4-pentenoate hydratase